MLEEWVKQMQNQVNSLEMLEKYMEDARFGPFDLHRPLLQHLRIKEKTRGSCCHG